MRERFSMRCRRSDITPCPDSTSEEEWTKHVMEWPMEGGIMTGSREAKQRVQLATLQGLHAERQGGEGQQGDQAPAKQDGADPQPA